MRLFDFFKKRKEYFVQTGFIGSKKEVEEFVQEWDDVAGDDGAFFFTEGRKDTHWYVTGFVSHPLLKRTNIENNFLIEEL